MSKDIPIDPQTIPHQAIEKVVNWLGINFETTVTRKPDGKKIVIRIMSEDKDNELKAKSTELKSFTKDLLNRYNATPDEWELFTILL